MSVCPCIRLSLSLHSVILSRPLVSLYLSHSLSLGVSRRCSVFPQCLVTVADFVSVQWLITTTYALSFCVWEYEYVWAYACACMCVCVKHQQSVILRKLLCLNSRHRHSTFNFLTTLFASPADFITCIICILLASISQRAIAFCHTMSHPLPCCRIFSLSPSVFLYISHFLSASHSILHCLSRYWPSACESDETLRNTPLLATPHCALCLKKPTTSWILEDMSDCVISFF